VRRPVTGADPVTLRFGTGIRRYAATAGAAHRRRPGPPGLLARLAVARQRRLIADLRRRADWAAEASEFPTLERWTADAATWLSPAMRPNPAGGHATWRPADHPRTGPRTGEDTVVLRIGAYAGPGPRTLVLPARDLAALRPDS
jgi:hypothetical protein